MQEDDESSPHRFHAFIRNALLKGFAIPLLVLAFFAIAPVWLNHNVREQVLEAAAREINITSESGRSRIQYYEAMDFEAIALGNVGGAERLRATLENAGITGQFRRLRWALIASIVVVGLVAVTCIAVTILNKRARRARNDIISSYRLAWWLCMVTSLIKVVLLIPLLIYGLYELTSLAFGTYIPKLLLLVLIGGGYALFKSVQAIIARVPLEFNEDMLVRVTPEEAPELWANVRSAAQRLNTAPPDNILVGMQLNFYVTEFAVRCPAGGVEGRTLYLSLPLLRQLSREEVMAIIGHELGHFRGEDTRLSREFYPMHYRVEATLHGLAESGWVGWTSFQALLFFHWSFRATEQNLSRDREFLADKAGAEITSHTIAARALVKVHVLSEAFHKALNRKEIGPANIFAAPLLPYIKTELAPQPQYWANLLTTVTAHPLDSHPTLKARLSALGCPADMDSAVEAALHESTPAYDVWFAGLDTLFEKIVEEASGHVGRIREELLKSEASLATEEGRRLLADYPDIRWKGRSAPLILALSIAGILGVISVGVALTVDSLVAQLGGCTVALALLIWGVQQFRIHRNPMYLVTAESLHYSGWKRPLAFADVAEVRAHSSYGTLTLTFFTKTKQSSIWRHSLLPGKLRRGVSVSVSSIGEKQTVVLETLEKYVTRQMRG